MDFLSFSRSHGCDARVGAGIRNRLTVGDIGARAPIALSLLTAFVYIPNREWTPLPKGLSELGVPSNSYPEAAGGAGNETNGRTVGETCIVVATQEIDGGDRSFHYLRASAAIAKDATGLPLRLMPRFPNPVWRRRFAKPLHP